MQKTHEEIKAEIAKLKEMKPKVRHYSELGDNHHDAIDAQVEVLENNLCSDDVYDLHDNENERDAAVEAVDWREGDEGMAPSENWAPLIQ